MKREHRKSIIKHLVLSLCCLFLAGVAKQPVQAASGEVTYGSDSYQWEQGATHPIGVYISGDETIAEYEVCLSYDTTKLRYIDGASEQAGNLLYIRGTGTDTQYKFMLHFETLEPGSTRLQIVSAVCSTVEKPVSVSGDDVLEAAADPFQMDISASAPIHIGAEISSRLIELVTEPQNIADFSPDVLEYSIEVPAETDKLDISYITEEEQAEVTVSDNTLETGENTITVTVKGTEERIYTIRVEKKAPVEVTEPETEASEEASGGAIAATPEPAETAEPSETTEEVQIPEPEETEEPSVQMPKISISSLILWVCFFFTAVLAVVYAGMVLRDRLREREQRKNQPENVKVINLDSTIIRVSHVTMKFRMAKDEASSLKEYFIRTVKKQNHYTYLKALDDVSFEVKQGDVLGIIGTNGSGKSTILKIVSGALKPTSGNVEVDRSKVQMLTLGTGFDMELTARENVYLNGSIIGYTKEYIDEKYEDIVKFAELEGFMEERMKNFSSGMVSRLGFAIATMRDAPDILILDEVLSVGDMFFRKKSEARIKEMIHSGATVLIVSHSMDTIMKNCNKVAWIEKGVLQMIGDPKTVCDAYKQLDP